MSFYPPGAQSDERFINTCYNCNLCVQNCPNKIITKADDDFGAVHIDYSKGYCEKNCNKCSQVCPYGAIKRTVQGIIIDSSKCIGCAKCKVSCKFDAIEIFAIKKQSLI